jgi:hypothetical protein
MSETTLRDAVPIPAGRASDLLAIAARAPSIFNTQPWLFRVTRYSIELYADPSRKLRADLAGREMLISCGAALFSLRLAVRSLGYQPVVGLLPDPDRPRLLARVHLGAAAPMTDRELQMLVSLPRRHTHRGVFAPGPLPRGLLVGMQHDAVAERATLALIDRPLAFEQLASIVAQAARSQSLNPQTRADVRKWVRPLGSCARDGVPASTIAPQPGRLAERELDLGRGLVPPRNRAPQPGERPRSGAPLPPGLPSSGAPPAATAVLLTQADTRADWLRAGQALHRLLAHAATRWVFATLNSQPLESASVRELIRTRLALPGAPQLLLQFGVARTAQATARRPPDELIEGDPSR